MIRDRRSGSDRRSKVRYATEIEIEWEGAAGRETGTISDLSETGCFVLCSGDVEDGEAIKMIFSLANNRTISLSGTVVNHIYEIGFAVRFAEQLGANEQHFLDKLLEHLERTGNLHSGR